MSWVLVSWFSIEHPEFQTVVDKAVSLCGATPGDAVMSEDKSTYFLTKHFRWFLKFRSRITSLTRTCVLPNATFLEPSRPLRTVCFGKIALTACPTTSCVGF